MRPQPFFIVFFKNLHVWSVGSFFDLKWNWPSESIKPLSSALRRKFDEVKKDKEPIEKLQLVTLHFDGTMEPRINNAKNGFKGKLFFAHKDDVIYSKIDVRNGAIGIVPDNMPCIAVSSEFPVYTVNQKVALPQYVKLLFQTSYFRRAINSMISGTSGRKRVQPSQIEVIEVPFPPLPIQGAIVEQWETAISEITATEERIKTFNVNIDKEFLSSIGLNPDSNQSHKKAFAVRWDQLSRWDVPFAQNLGKKILSSLYHNVTVFDVIQPLRTTTTRSNPKLNPKEKVNYIGLANVESSTGRLLEFSPVLGGKIESSCVVFDEEHILYAKLRPYLRKVICPIEYGLSNGVASSEFLSLKPRENILRDFLVHYLRSTAVEIQARQAIGARMPRISSESLLSFIIPLPPLNIQQNILDKVKEMQVQVMQQIEIVERKSQEIKAEIESLILGTKQIKGI